MTHRLLAVALSGLLAGLPQASAAQVVAPPPVLAPGPAPDLARDTVADAEQQARLDVASESAALWASFGALVAGGSSLVGCLVGLAYLLPLAPVVGALACGAAGLLAVGLPAYSGKAETEAPLAGHGVDYQVVYRQAYTRERQLKRAGYAFVAGGVAVALVTGLAVAAAVLGGGVLRPGR